MLSIVMFAAPVALAPAPPLPVAQYHADCARPVYASDQMVCQDEALRAMDQRLAVLFDAAVAVGGEALAADQAEWFRQRSLCAFKARHRACLVRAYKQRNKSLTMWINTHGVAEP